MKVLGVIPARYRSTRLEGKPLANILGKPMIRYVYEAACKATSLSDVVVATDDERIAHAVRQFGGEAVMTAMDHASGTDRVAEVARERDAAIVVNIQGDEPLIQPRMIDECVEALRHSGGAGLSTVMKRISEEAFHDPGVVKVVCDARGRALYFSRSLIPYPRARTGDFAVFEHIGLYAYTRECLLRLAALPPARLELIEGLEQLRALESGITIQVVETQCGGDLISVDTAEDLERVRAIVAAGVCN
ncbi:MAG TPA: 3-deoxy-manno-octulosonate cytidylyltransferase [Bryobacteraceae bacterium]|jgi:3-deoxy-manno-octulosonate cytidylyltransferase (CMP-KDO synthetase)|nr:3-deoxy-manno-octulosonate cytidylyltransferase [Bryobacteraceae bacterium]